MRMKSSDNLKAELAFQKIAKLLASLTICLALLYLMQDN